MSCTLEMVDKDMSYVNGLRFETINKVLRRANEVSLEVWTMPWMSQGMAWKFLELSNKKTRDYGSTQVLIRSDGAAGSRSSLTGVIVRALIKLFP